MELLRIRCGFVAKQKILPNPFKFGLNKMNNKFSQAPSNFLKDLSKFQKACHTCMYLNGKWSSGPIKGPIIFFVSPAKHGRHIGIMSLSALCM